MRRWLFAVVLAACSRHRAPRVEVPIVVARPGLSAVQLEREIAVPLERAVAGVKGVVHVTTRSEMGRVVAMIEVAGTAEAFDVRQELISRASFLTQLGPTVVDRATLRYAVPPAASESLRRQLLQVPGVADVTTCAGAEPTRIVELDAARLRAFGLLASGIVVDAAAAVPETVIDQRNGAPVRLGDVAVIQRTTRSDCTAVDAHGPVATGTVVLRFGEDDADAVRERIRRLVAIAKGRMLPATSLVFVDSTDTAAIATAVATTPDAIVETGEGEPWEPLRGSRAYVTGDPFDAIDRLHGKQIEAYTATPGLSCGAREQVDSPALQTSGHLIGREHGRSLEIDDDLAPGVTLDAVEQMLELVGPGTDVGRTTTRVIVHVTGDPDVARAVPLSAVTHTVDDAPLVRLRHDGQACVAIGAVSRQTNILQRAGELHQVDL